MNRIKLALVEIALDKHIYNWTLYVVQCTCVCISLFVCFAHYFRYMAKHKCVYCCLIADSVNHRLSRFSLFSLHFSLSFFLLKHFFRAVVAFFSLLASFFQCLFISQWFSRWERNRIKICNIDFFVLTHTPVQIPTGIQTKVKSVPISFWFNWIYFCWTWSSSQLLHANKWSLQLYLCSHSITIHCTRKNQLKYRNEHTNIEEISDFQSDFYTILQKKFFSLVRAFGYFCFVLIHLSYCSSKQSLKLKEFIPKFYIKSLKFVKIF